jgi:hypothetical protein
MSDFDDYTNVYGRIEIEVDLAEVSANGAMFDLLGLASSVRQHLESLPMNGSQMRVLGVAPVTKMWELEAQLRNNTPFNDIRLDKEIPQ